MAFILKNPNYGSGVTAALVKPIGTAGAVQLYGEPLNPATLTLADMTSRTPGQGEIGLKNGKLALGDSVTVGGNVVSAESINNIKKTFSIPASRLNCEVGTWVLTGDITQSGQLQIIWQVNGSNISTLNIPVIIGETSYSYNRKIVAALNADTAFSASYIAYNCGGIIQIQDKTSNRTTLTSISFSNGTSAGVSSTFGKTIQKAFIELGEFQILAANANITNKFILTGCVSILSSGTPVGVYLGLRASEQSFLPDANVGLNFPITSGGGAVTHNHYNFLSTAKFDNGNGCPVGCAYLTNSQFSGAGKGFITETALNGTSIQAMTNIVPDTPGGNNYGYSKMGRSSIACMMIMCNINLTGTASALLGLDLQFAVA